MRCIIGEENTVLAQELIQAYLETEYRCASLGFTLRICEANHGLADLYLRQQCRSAAYITACNPWSQELDATRNAQRQQDLEAALTAQGSRFWVGEGAHPSGEWTPEPSFLVADMSLEAASKLGQYWEQNAIVWCDEHAKPWLVLLR